MMASLPNYLTIRTPDLQAIFDICIYSMDFGSGFLDGEDVPALRRIAEALGVDPMQATPDNERWKYAHPFSTESPRAATCQTCRQTEDIGNHDAV